MATERDDDWEWNPPHVSIVLRLLALAVSAVSLVVVASSLFIPIGWLVLIVWSPVWIVVFVIAFPRGGRPVGAIAWNLGAIPLSMAVGAAGSFLQGTVPVPPPSSSPPVTGTRSEIVSDVVVEEFLNAAYVEGVDDAALLAGHLDRPVDAATIARCWSRPERIPHSVAALEVVPAASGDPGEATIILTYFAGVEPPSYRFVGPTKNELQARLRVTGYRNWTVVDTVPAPPAGCPPGLPPPRSAP